MNPTKQLTMRDAVNRVRADIDKNNMKPNKTNTTMRDAVNRVREGVNENPNDSGKNGDYERRFRRLERACVNFPFCICKIDDPSKISDIPKGNIVDPSYKIVCIDFDTREIHSKNTVYFKRIERDFIVGAIRVYGLKISKMKINVLSEDGTVPNGYRLWICEREKIP